MRAIARPGIFLLLAIAAALFWPSPGHAAGPGVAAITAGRFHTCALTAEGAVKCWGHNEYGQLGAETTELCAHPTVYDRPCSTRPIDVTDLTGGVSAIAAGFAHTCALTTAGAVKCWGWNGAGELGDGTTTSRPTPVDVVGLTGPVAAVSAGGGSTCALTNTGGVQCWGDDSSGQLGDGTTTSRPTPADVLGLASGVAAVSVGGSHTCALTTEGTTKCWGANSSGQLGDGTKTDSTTPVDVVGLPSGVAAIAAGGAHTCALTAAGGLECWGDNSSGQLGDGTGTSRTSPVAVAGLESGIAAVAAAGHHTCAVTTAGGVKCWGENITGELGDATIWRRATPVDVCTDWDCAEYLSDVAAVTAASGGQTVGLAELDPDFLPSHTCALTTTGGVQCWGNNRSGQLGNGTSTGIDSNPWPVDVTGLAPPRTPTLTPSDSSGPSVGLLAGVAVAAAAGAVALGAAVWYARRRRRR